MRSETDKRNLPEIGLGCANLLRASLPEFIGTAARHGFRRITVRPHAFATAVEEGLTGGALREMIAAAGIEVTMIDALTNVLPGVAAPDSLGPGMRDRMPPDVLHPPNEETVLSAAEATGASIVNLTHYLGVPTPADQLAEAVAGICRRAGDRGLTVGLEFIPGTGLPDLPFTQGVVEACGAANCGIVLDVFHLDRSGGTVDDIARLPPGAIAGVQLSDRERPPPDVPHLPFAGRCLPGEGDLPLGDLVRAAFDNSPDATLDIEVLNAELAALSFDETAACLAEGARSWLATL